MSYLPTTFGHFLVRLRPCEVYFTTPPQTSSHCKPASRRISSFQRRSAALLNILVVILYLLSLLGICCMIHSASHRTTRSSASRQSLNIRYIRLCWRSANSCALGALSPHLLGTSTTKQRSSPTLVASSHTPCLGHVWKVVSIKHCSVVELGR